MDFKNFFSTDNIGVIIFVVVILLILVAMIYITYANFKERGRTTNNDLPDLQELEKNERLKKMKENSEEYDFAVKKPLTKNELKDLNIASDEGSDYTQLIEGKNKDLDEENIAVINDLLDVNQHDTFVVNSDIKDNQLPNLTSEAKKPALEAFKQKNGIKS